MARAPHPSPAPLRLSLLGAFHIEHRDKTVRLPTRKIESLFAYLVLHPEPQPREKLAALFWGDVTDEQARGSLRKALTLLRAAFGSEIVVADRQTIQLSPDIELWCDAHALESATQAQEWGSLAPMNETAHQVTLLYRGDLLADSYDDWVIPLREHYRNRYIATLLSLVQGYRANSEYARAVALAQQILALDTANERAHQHLMFCFVGLGDRAAALKQYQECVRALRDELAAEPARETQALYEWIQQFSGERAASQAQATNLPLPLSSFIGRQRETADLTQYLKANIRLVTLTGPGGSGKTRLAIQTATDLICQDDSTGRAFPDGVWWVELASISDASNVIPQIAKTLGVRESPQQELVITVQSFLQTKQLLLILDNCEHVLETSAQTAHELLSSAPQIKILATSRQPLRIAGEQVYPVPPLNVPRRQALSYVELLSQFEGVRLFVERAQAVQPAFALTAENAPAIAQICARLDGIPLALELAASRAQLLSPAEIASRLDARFDLLRDANRAAPPRHQTLRAVIDWSCELLSPEERALFRRMSVFAGGCTLTALEHVAPGDGDNSTFHLLARLVEKSLVITTRRNGVTRYGMLETIQEYARDMLHTAGETEPLRALHVDYFAAYAAQAEREMRGPDVMHWLDSIEIELDNIRAALDWSAGGNPELGLQLAGRLEWFWNLRGYWREGAARLDKLLTVQTNITPRTRARALVAGANLWYWSDMDNDVALVWLENAIVLYRSELPMDRWGLAYALALYGEVLSTTQKREQARPPLIESVRLANGLGEEGKWVAAWAYMSLGGQPDPPATRQAALEKSVSLFRELRDAAQLQVALARCAWFYMSEKQFDRARERAQEALHLTQAIGDALGLAWQYRMLGDLSHSEGDLLQAKVYYRTSLERFTQIGNPFGVEMIQDLLRELD